MMDDEKIRRILSRVDVIQRRTHKDNTAAYGHSKVVKRLPRDPKAPR